jgi:hypothetical protein
VQVICTPPNYLSTPNLTPKMSADFWAGYVSGAAGIIIGNPLDLIKTRLQAGNTAPNVEATSTAVPVHRGFKGTFENAGTLVKGEQKKYNSLKTENHKQRHHAIGE